MDAASPSQRGAVPEVRRDFSFNVHVGQGVLTKQVIEAFLALVPPASGRACHPYDGGRFTLTVKTSDAADKLREAGCLVVGGSSYELLPLASKVKAVTLLLLPVEVPDYAVAQVLGAYGKVIRMTRETHREYPSLETGTRRVVMEMEKEVPNYTQVCGFQGMCLYSGMRKTCRRCGLGGHLSYDCRTPRCTRCGEYGHAGPQCRAPCKQCGDDHPTSRCPVNTYANVLAGETPSSAQKTGSHDEIHAATAGAREVDRQLEPASEQGGGAASPLISNTDGADNSSVSEGAAISTEDASAEESAHTESTSESSTAQASSTSEPGSKDDTATGGDTENEMEAVSQSIKRQRSSSSSRDSTDSRRKGHPLPEVVARLSAGDADDYDKVKSSLLKRYRLSAEAFRQRFRNASKKSSEGYSEFAYGLKTNLIEWLKSEEVYESRDKVVECVCLEQFFRSIPQSVKLWVQDSVGVDSVERAAELAEEYATRRKLSGEESESGRSDQRKTFRQGNGSRENGPEKPEAGQKVPEKSAEHSNGDKARKSPTGQFEARKPFLCYNCQEPGHTAARCKKPRVVFSYVNGSDKDLKLLRPYLHELQVNGKPCRVLRDSAATMDVVHPSYVTTSDFTGKVVWIKQLLEKHSVCLPMAT
ncbi:hypothetical protein HPB47_021106, partial [Ixodes persulcatus]